MSYAINPPNDSPHIMHYSTAYLFRTVHIVQSQIWSHAENTSEHAVSCKQVLKRTLDSGRKAARWANAINQRRNVVPRISSSTSTTSKKVLGLRDPLARRERATARNPRSFHVGREVLYHFCENNLRGTIPFIYRIAQQIQINYSIITSRLI